MTDVGADARAGASRGARLVAHARLTRPLNAAISVAGVVVGAWLAVGAPALATPGVWRAALAAALLGGGANALNDSLDVATDRVNRPGRPIPSGRATVRSARVLWGLLTAIALVLAASVSLWHLGVAGASAGLLAVYTRHLKPRVLVGNVAVAAVVAAAVAFGARAAAPGLTPPVVAAVAFAFLLTLAREIVKDIEDADGDAASGLRTLPLVAGARVATFSAMAVVLLVLAALPVPSVALGLGDTYLVVALGVALALAAALRALAAADAARASRALKGAMLLGLLALVLGTPS